MIETNFMGERMMNPVEMDFSRFLDNFVPKARVTEKRANNAWWQLAVSSSLDAQHELEQAIAEHRLLFSDKDIYNQLVQFEKSGEIKDALLSRQLQCLLLSFKGNILPEDLIREMAQKDAQLEKTFASFRPTLYGKNVSNNEIDKILKEEQDVQIRKDAWEASKQVGPVMAPLIQEAVSLRNRSAKILGYQNYFEMAYRLGELDPDEVVNTFDDLVLRSEPVWRKLQIEIGEQLASRFAVATNKIGPWAWGDPFSQHDPLENSSVINPLFSGHDVIKVAAEFYKSIGMDVSTIIDRSDLLERDDKNPHAFCTHIDRCGDIRVLANIKPNLYWFSTMLHELGHAVYELYLNKNLPWLLCSPSHTLTTEAMAILVQKYAQHAKTLRRLFDFPSEAEHQLKELERGYVRDQLVFSRWANVMVRFEKAMYENPNQNLQQIWWGLVHKYQGITPPAGRDNTADWAAKIHIGTAPCYYQNYLLGYLFASQINSILSRITGDTSILGHEVAGEFLQKRLFAPGNSLRWNDLVKKVTSEQLNPTAWITEIEQLN